MKYLKLIREPVAKLPSYELQKLFGDLLLRYLVLLEARQFFLKGPYN